MARKKRQQPYEEIKASILLTALELMVKRSINLNLNEVASSVGMTKAALYWYFPKKEDLLNELSLMIYDAYVQKAKSIVQSEDSNYEKLKKIILGTQDDIQSALMAVFPIKVFLEYYSENNQMKALVQRGYEEYNECIKTIINNGINNGCFKTNMNPEHIAKFITGAVDGLAIQNLLPMSECIEVSRDIILYAVEHILNYEENERGL